MKFLIQNKEITKSLRQLNTIINNRHPIKILSYLLLQVKDKSLYITSSNIELEITAKINLIENFEVGLAAISARKFFTICKNLPEKSYIKFLKIKNKIFITCNTSKFTFTTLEDENYPYINFLKSEIKFNFSANLLKKLIEYTYFSIANQDIRNYMNGLLLEFNNNNLRAISTDGHRLSMFFILIKEHLLPFKVIIPKRCILEILRALNNVKSNIILEINNIYIKIYIKNYIFISKLIDSKFPECINFFNIKYNIRIEINTNILLKCCNRVAILVNEKFYKTTFSIDTNLLIIKSKNSYNETAKEYIKIIYNGPKIEICFNINYIIDILKVIKEDIIYLFINNSYSNINIMSYNNNNLKYIVSPII